MEGETRYLSVLNGLGTAKRIRCHVATCTMWPCGQACYYLGPCCTACAGGSFVSSHVALAGLCPT